MSGRGFSSAGDYVEIDMEDVEEIDPHVDYKAFFCPNCEDYTPHMTDGEGDYFCRYCGVV